MLRVEWLAETLWLSARRALYWERAQTLLIADPHFGKDAAFRSAGVPVPAGSLDADLARLSALLDDTRARRLIILGDLLHARAGRTAAVIDPVAHWRAARPALEIDLVRGNHDASAGDPPDSWRIRCAAAPLLPDGPFAFLHEPAPHDTRYTLAGHIHPAIQLSAAVGPGLRAPCFWFGHRCAVLPAFGSFTGAGAIRPAPADRVFAVGPNEVVEIALPGAGPQTSPKPPIPPRRTRSALAAARRNAR